MGSQCKVNIIAKEEFSMSVIGIMGDNHEKKNYEFWKDEVTEIHLHFPRQYSITFYPDTEYKTKMPQEAYFTITNVSDFCWFVLMLNDKYRDILEVAGARPDPIKMILAVIERW